MVALGVENDTVFGLISAAIRSPNDVMVMPARQFGDFLKADGAETVLFFPEVEQLPSSSYSRTH